MRSLLRRKPRTQWADALQGDESEKSRRNTEIVGAFVARMLGPGDRLLDVGCGWGRLPDRLREAGVFDPAHYVGVEHGAAMVEVAREHIPDVDIVEGSVDALPFADGSFDVVVAMGVLELLQDYEAAVVELLRVSRRLVVVGLSAVGEGQRDWVWRADVGGYWLTRHEPARIRAFALGAGARLTAVVEDAEPLSISVSALLK